MNQSIINETSKFCQQAENRYKRCSNSYQNMQRSSQFSQTDKRIQQIKRKYDTPNRKQRLSELSNKKSDYLSKQKQNYGTADFKAKSFVYAQKSQQIHKQNCLKQSKLQNYPSKSMIYNDSYSLNKDSILMNKIKGCKDNQIQNKNSRLYSNHQNDQDFFKRVKQMKQSLLYSDNGIKNVQKSGIRNTFRRQQQKIKNNYDSNQTLQKDRIQNIDKINQKIKGILQCLNQNDKGRLPLKYNQHKPQIKYESKCQLKLQPKYQPKYQSKYQSKPKTKANIDAQIQQYSRNKQLNRDTSKSIFVENTNEKPKYLNHRHEKSQLLQKISVNSNFNQAKAKANKQEDQKWERLSGKLEKYQLENKLRLKKALDQSKQPEQKQINQKIQSKTTKFFQTPLTVTLTQTPKPNTSFKRQSSSIDIKDMRSRSFINSNLTQQQRDRSLHMRNQTKDYQMRSGKKLDDQIVRINKKIQQFEQQKKRMNIDFKPFTYSNTKSSSNLLNTGISSHKYEISDKKISQFTRSLYKQQQKNEKAAKQSKAQQKSEAQSTFRQIKHSGTQQNMIGKIQSRLSKQIQIKLQKSNLSIRTSKFVSQNTSQISLLQDQSYTIQHSTKQQIQKQSKKSSKLQVKQEFVYFFDQNLKKQTDQGIQERKRKLIYGGLNQDSNCQVKLLVKGLCQQVQLDQEFRNAKIWYQYNNHTNKEQQIKNLFPTNDINQIREFLKVRESQNNPFFSVQGYQSNFTNVANAYKLAQNHWNNTIFKKFDKVLLENQGFTQKEIDLDNKKHISLGDLVRFLNLQSGTFYRNRDLSLIFIRICKLNKSQTYTQTQFEWLLNTFCS